MKMTRSILALAAIGFAMPVLAQDKDAVAAKQMETPGTDEGRDAGTRDLNRQAAADARGQNAANAGEAASYTQAVQDYEAERSRVARARAEYEARMEAHRRAQSDYQAAHAQWQEDVAACERGDLSRCAQPLR